MNIFLSFNSKDTALAEMLRAGIARVEPGAQIFFSPVSLGAGFWLPKLADGIGAANAFILLMGPNGIGPWQETEYYEAFSRHVRNRSFMLVPVLAAKSQAPGLPFLRNLNWVEAPIITDDQTLRRLLAALRGENVEGATPIWKIVNPYSGLEAMTETNSDYFHGRTAETNAVLLALADHPGRFPILVGASGVGKTSVAQAGVLSALKSMRLPEAEAPWPVGLANSRAWVQLTMRPGDAPFAGLTAVFTNLWGLDSRDPNQAALPRKWADRLRNGDNTLADLIGATQDELKKREGERPGRILLYVDQIEELYTRSPEAEARRFSEMLAEGLDERQFSAFGSLRADYFDRLQADRALLKYYEHINVAPLDPVQLSDVVTTPAMALGVHFEDERTAERITTAAAAEPGALPLLSYLLTDMWDGMVNRGDATLRLASKAIDIGGVLASRAEEFLRGNPDWEGTLRRLLILKLAALAHGGEPIRREARREECTEAEWALAGRLAEYPWRLLVVGERRGDSEVVAELAHEALLGAWPRLSSWLREEREFLVFKADAERAEQRWQAKGTADNALLAGLDLVRAEEWLPKRSDDLSRDVRVQRSLAADQVQKQRRLRFQRRVILGALVALALIAVIAAVAEHQRQRAEQALAATMQIANTLVFDIGQDPRVRALPIELLRQMWDRAVEGYDQAIKLDPNNAAAYNGRGGAYSAKGEIDHALADYDEAIILDPKLVSAYNNRGNAYERKGDFDHAIADLDQAIKLAPKFAIQYNNRGSAYHGKRNFDHAIADYNEAIILNPKYTDAYTNRGAAYREKGELDLAIADFDQAISLDPRFAPAFVNRGLAYQDKRDFNYAIADYNQAVLLDPKLARAYSGRGDAYYAKGDLDHAVADYDQAIMLDPKFPLVYVGRAKVHGDRRDFDHAISDLDQAVALDPSFAPSYGTRGMAHYARSEFDDAISDYNQAIVLDPQSPISFVNRGLVYLLKGDVDHAIADLDQAIALDPKFAQAFLNRGNAFYKKLDFDRSIADYSHAVLLDPALGQAYGNRGLAYYAKGEPQRAISDYDRAIMVDPNSTFALSSRGYAYLKLGQPDNAIANSNMALKINSKLASSLCGRGLAKLKKGESAGADADFDAARQINADIAEEVDQHYSIK